MRTLESQVRQRAVIAAQRYNSGLAVHGDGLVCGTNNPEFMHDKDVLTLTCWAADWFRLGFPTMTIGHKYAAALMTTTIPDVPIAAPWPTFLIRLPDNMMSLENETKDNCLEPLCLMACIHFGNKWFWFAFTEGRSHLHRANLTESEMRNCGFEIDGSNLTKHDERTMVALTRLLMNACVAMSDPRNVRPAAKGTAAPSIDSTGCPRYAGGTFQLGAPVTVDCREPLQAFLRGVPHARSSLRWLVRGHWRNQACGPRLEQRAMKWIEPYWKGDRDNALLIRDHKLNRAME